MPEKCIELSPYFADVAFTVWKLGEWDHGYLIRISARPEFSVSFELHEKELDDFLDGLEEFVEN